MSYYLSRLYEWRYFWYISTIPCVLAVILLTKRYWLHGLKTWNEGRKSWISYKLWEIRKSCIRKQAKRTDLRNAKAFFRELIRLRTGWSIPLYMLAMLAITSPLSITIKNSVYFSLIGQWLKDVLPQTDNFLITLWQVHATIVSITFVVVAFVIQLLGRKEAYENNLTGLILGYTRFKWIVALNFLAVLITASAAFQEDINLSNWVLPYFAVLLLYFAIISTIFLLFRVLELFSPQVIDQILMKQIREQIQKSIDKEIDQKLAWHLMASFCKENQLQYCPIDIGVDLKAIRAKKRGVISDVNLKKLQIFSTLLENQVLGFPYNYKGVIIGTVGYEIAENDVLGRIAEADYNESIALSLRQSFRIKHREVGVWARELTDSLSRLKERAIQSVNTGSALQFKNILNMHKEFIEQFLETAKAYQIRLDARSAKQMFTPPDWPSLGHITRNIRDILEAVIRSENRELILDILYFIRRNMTMAIEYGDHLVFEELVHLYTYAYSLSRHIRDENIRALAIYRIWRNIEECSDYDLARRYLEDSRELPSIFDSVSDYIKRVLLTFNHLIKLSLDQEDIESLRAFKRVFDNFLRRFAEKHDEFQLENIDWQLQNTLDRQLQNVEEKISEEAIITLRQQKRQEAKAIELRDIILRMKRQIPLGLGGWLVKLYMQQKIQEPFFRQAFDTLSRAFQDMNALSIAFLEIRESRDAWRAYEWRQWVVDPQAIDAYMVHFYFLLSLKKLSKQIPEADMAYLDNSSLSSAGLESIRQELVRVIEEITSNTALWSSIITEEELDKSDDLLEFHDRGIKKKKAKEEEHLKNAEIDDNIQRDFREAFHQEWSQGIVRNLISRLGVFEDKTGKPYKGKRNLVLQIDRRDMKNLYIRGATARGRQYGDVMFRRENQRILESVSRGVKCVSRKVLIGNVPRQLDRAIAELRGRGYSPNAIIYGSLEIQKQLRESAKYALNQKAQVESDGTSPQWCYDGIELYLLFKDQVPADEILVLDLKSLGKLTQYQVSTAPGDIFGFEITAYNKEMAESLIKKHPEILNDKDGNTRSTTAVVEELRKQVHLRILEKLEFSIENDRAGLKVKYYPPA